MAHQFGYYRELEGDVEGDVSVWNVAAHQAASGIPLKVAVKGVARQRHGDVVNAYRRVQEAIDDGLFVREIDIESRALEAGRNGESLEALLELVAPWLDSVATAYWEQARIDASVGASPQYSEFDRVVVTAIELVESFGYCDVRVERISDPFIGDRFTVSCWDSRRSQPVVAVRSVRLCEVEMSLQGWARTERQHRDLMKRLQEQQVEGVL